MEGRARPSLRCGHAYGSPTACTPQPRPRADATLRTSATSYALPTVAPSGCQSSLSCFDWSNLRSTGGEMPAVSSSSGSSDLFTSLPLDMFLSSVTSRTGAAVCALAVKGSDLASWSAIVSGGLNQTSGRAIASSSSFLGRCRCPPSNRGPSCSALQKGPSPWHPPILSAGQGPGLGADAPPDRQGHGADGHAHALHPGPGASGPVLSDRHVHHGRPRLRLPDAHRVERRRDRRGLQPQHR